MVSVIQIPSSFFDEREAGVTIDTIVVHSMYNPEVPDPCDAQSAIALLNRFRDSSHYFIDRSGTVVQTVPEEKRARHAGASRMPDGREGVNAFSIGIEVICVEGSEFSDPQYHALTELILSIAERHPIRFVVGHRHIATPIGRKRDPWDGFSWERLIAAVKESAPHITFPL